MITSSGFLAAWAMAWVVLIRTLLVRADLLPPTCPRCGRQFERRWLGDDDICRCDR